jgi:hypothetical protein
MDLAMLVPAKVPAECRRRYETSINDMEHDFKESRRKYRVFETI